MQYKKSLRALCAALVLPIASASAQVATLPMIGHWKGDAEIAVNWTKVKTLTVDLTIAADDRVTGKIGDAMLVDGRLSSNRSWFTRRLGLKTDYIIEAKLEGPVIAAEDIVREAVRMPLNFINGRFEGGVNTSGSEFGGAKSMILAARGLVLRRVPDMVVCAGSQKAPAIGRKC